jgi:hypothetical protein
MIAGLLYKQNMHIPCGFNSEHKSAGILSGAKQNSNAQRNLINR